MRTHDECLELVATFSSCINEIFNEISEHYSAQLAGHIMAHMNVIRGQKFVMLRVSLNFYYDKCHRFELRFKFDDYFVLMSTMVVIVTVLVMTALTALFSV